MRAMFPVFVLAVAENIQKQASGGFCESFLLTAEVQNIVYSPLRGPTLRRLGLLGHPRHS